MQPSTTTSRAPALFVAHGAPTLAIDAHKGEAFARWGTALARPTALLVVSAHWEQAPITIGTIERRPLVYDFYGFPDELYRVRYDAPAAPGIAERVAALVGGNPVVNRDRGWDHGVWVPLVHLFPRADVPLLQISMPSREGPAALFELGRRLAPLRDEGVLIVGSGNLTHNLRRVDWSNPSTPVSWAAEFDAWTAETLARRDWDALVAYRERAPGLRLAHPTEEHFQPVLVAAGAAADAAAVTFPVEGFEYGSLSRRSVQIA